jgi:hypothetical protein
VEVNDIVTAVNMALGQLPLVRCPHFDVHRDGEITVDEIIRAVNVLLGTAPCPAYATPTPLPTATAMVAVELWPASGSPGQVVEFPLVVDDRSALALVDGVNFDMVYDPAVLTELSCEKASATLPHQLAQHQLASYQHRALLYPPADSPAAGLPDGVVLKCRGRIHPSACNGTYQVALTRVHSSDASGRAQAVAVAHATLTVQGASCGAPPPGGSCALVATGGGSAGSDGKAVVVLALVAWVWRWWAGARRRASHATRRRVRGAQRCVLLPLAAVLVVASVFLDTGQLMAQASDRALLASSTGTWEEAGGQSSTPPHSRLGAQGPRRPKTLWRRSPKP